MARRVVIFDDFSKGEFGRMGPRNAPKGSWTGENMTVYRDGSIGVRSGVKHGSWAGATDTETHHELASAQDSDYAIILDSSTTFETFQMTGTDGLNAGAGAMDSAYNSTSSWTRGGPGVIYINNGATDNDSYSFTVSEGTGIGTIAKLANSPGGNGGIALYGEQLVVGAPSGDTDAIAASAAGNFGSWPSAAIVPIGNPNSDVRAIYTVKNSLVIMKAEGIFLLTGVIGVNESVRLIINADPVDTGQQNAGAVTGYNVLWWQPEQFPSPTYFDGAYDRRADHIRTKGIAERLVSVDRERDCIIFHARENDEVGEGEGDTMVKLWRNGHWEIHRFNHAMLNVSPVSTDNDTAYSIIDCTTDVWGWSGDAPTLVVFLPRDATDNEFNGFGQWLIGLDRPGILGEDFQSPTDDPDPSEATATPVTGFFSLPEWYADEGTEIMVRGVTVDFTAWDTGSDIANHFDLTVDAYNVWDNDSPSSSLTLEYDEDGGLSTAAGVYKRRVFSFGDQGLANGFQVHFTNVRGVAIRRIHVVIESQSHRGT